MEQKKIISCPDKHKPGHIGNYKKCIDCGVYTCNCNENLKKGNFCCLAKKLKYWTRTRIPCVNKEPHTCKFVKCYKCGYNRCVYLKYRECCTMTKFLKQLCEKIN